MKHHFVGSLVILLGLTTLGVIAYFGLMHTTGLVLGTTTVTKLFTWTPSGDTPPGDHTITIAATDDQGEQVTKVVTVAVATPEPTGSYFSISPIEGTYQVGKEFTVSVDINDVTDPVAAVLVDIHYSDALAFVRARADGTVFGHEISASTRALGQLQIARATLGDPFSGESGHVVDVTFKPVRSGEATITIQKTTSSAIASETFAETLLQPAGGASATISGSDQYICFRMALQERSADESQAITPVTVVIGNEANSNIRTVQVAGGSDGLAYVWDRRSLDRFINTQGPYSATLTPIGHLPLHVPNITELFDPNCHAAGTATWGDINQDGVLNETDLKRISEYFNGGSDKVLAALFPNYTLELRDVVQFIANTHELNIPTPSPTASNTPTPEATVTATPTSTPQPSDTPLLTPTP